MLRFWQRSKNEGTAPVRLPWYAQLIFLIYNLGMKACKIWVALTYPLPNLDTDNIKYRITVCVCNTSAYIIMCTNTQWHTRAQTCIHTHSDTHSNTHSHTHTLTHTHTRAHIYTHSDTYSNTHTHTHTHARTHTHTHRELWAMMKTVYADTGTAEPVPGFTKKTKQCLLIVLSINCLLSCLI